MEEAADEATADADADAEPEVALPEPELEELATPGFCVMLTSCSPSGMGPEGFAGQEPAGETGELMPKGIVPGEPTASPPTKVVSLTLWN